MNIARYGKVSKRVGGLHLRADDTKNSKSLDELNPGDRLFVYYTNEDQTWVRVQVDKSKQKGWVFLKDIDLEPEAPPVMEPIEEAPFWPILIPVVIVLLAIVGFIYW